MVLARDAACLLPRDSYLVFVQIQHDKDGNTTKRKVIWEGEAIKFPIVKGMENYHLSQLYVVQLIYHGQSYYMLNDIDEEKRIRSLDHYFNDEPASTLSQRSVQ